MKFQNLSDGVLSQGMLRLSVRILSPDLLRAETEDGIVFFVAADGASLALPGNGGLRVKQYASEEAAAQECVELAQVMTRKHALYGTGFSGAKLVALGSLDKQRLLDAVAVVLNVLQGTVYTGCDISTTLADMSYLSQSCPYVLSAVGTDIDPSAATAHGVVGSIMAVCGDRLREKTFLVHGTGNVGRMAARLLVELGGAVLTYDHVPERAVLPGCLNISEQPEWWRTPCDVLVPCSSAGLITAQVASELDCRWIVGSANLPLAADDVCDVLQKRGVRMLSEAISSAGAVLSDSVEQHAWPLFAAVNPNVIYHFVRDTVRRKTIQHLERCQLACVPALEELHEDVSREKAGDRFGCWLVEAACRRSFNPRPHAGAIEL